MLYIPNFWGYTAKRLKSNPKTVILWVLFGEKALYPHAVSFTAIHVEELCVTDLMVIINSERIHRKMIIIQMMGGLGNQLQQYAFYRKLNKCGIETKIDTSWYSEEVQRDMAAPRTLEIKRLKGVSFEEASTEEVYQLTGIAPLNGSDHLSKIAPIMGKLRRKLLPGTVKVFEENSRIFVSEIYDGIVNKKTIKDLYTKAHFACEYYYADILEDLRKEVSFPINEAKNYQKIVEMAKEMQSTNSVSVHIRRGDYLDDINAKYYGGICTEEYYEAAVKHVIESAGADSFYIFSDDIPYAEDFAQRIAKIATADREAGAVEAEEVTANGIKAKVINLNHADDSMFDIYLMSQCRHNITANSTFSFWGARFNANEEKMMIRPTKHINQQPFDIEDMRIWWKGWTFVSPTGEVFDSTSTRIVK